MAHIAFDVEDGTLARLHRDPVDFARELRIAAAVKWYQMGIVSQGRAAEISGLSRSEFIMRSGVTPSRRSRTHWRSYARRRA